MLPSDDMKATKRVVKVNRFLMKKLKAKKSLKYCFPMKKFKAVEKKRILQILICDENVESDKKKFLSSSYFALKQLVKCVNGLGKDRYPHGKRFRIKSLRQCC